MSQQIEPNTVRLLLDISDITSLLEESGEMIDRWSPDSPSFYRWLTKVQAVFSKHYPEESEDLARVTKMTELRRSRTTGRPNIDQAALGVRVGAIENELEGIRLELIPDQDAEAQEADSSVSLVPILRIFIGHDGATTARAKLEDFIRSLGAEPVITEREPNKGRSVATKVADTIRSCDFGVAIATAERGSEQDGSLIPRANITEEIPRLQSQFGDKWMLLIEEDLSMPSNQAEFVREQFRAENMESAFVALIRELRSHGLIVVGGSN